MADIKLFSIKGGVKELPSKQVTLEKARYLSITRGGEERRYSSKNGAIEKEEAVVAENATTASISFKSLVPSISS